MNFKDRLPQSKALGDIIFCAAVVWLMFLMLTLLIPSLQGCFPKARHLGKIDQAGYVGLAAEKQYTLIHNHMEEFLRTATLEQKKYMMKHVTPKLNLARKMLIDYLGAVEIAKMTEDGLTADELNRTAEEVKRLISEAIAAYNHFFDAG